MWPQYTYLALTIAGLMYQAYLHGKPRTGSHDFWSAFIATTIIMYILKWGGFFDPILQNGLR